MPKRGTQESIYQRGGYRLGWDRRRDGSLRSPYLQISWYDPSSGHYRSRSTGTADVPAAEKELDRLYLERERGQATCPTCGRPAGQAGRYLVTAAIADYLVARDGRTSIGSIRPRLAHVVDYLDQTGQTAISCDDVTADWIDDFREWAIEVPIIAPVTKAVRQRSPGTVEASVRQLAAAINLSHARRDTLYPASFRAMAPALVSRTPAYRADIPTLAAMFRYAMKRAKNGKLITGRRNLLRFLQLSVATWARPDAVHDFSTDHERRQWLSNARVAQLNPKGRVQTRKYRPAVPVPEAMARLLDATPGYYVPINSVRSAFSTMLDDLKLPRDGETGTKLIRRSMATLARLRLGEEHWIQGELMLGHRKASTSDVYALFEPGQLGRALAVTEAIIAEIDALAPGAYSPAFTGLSPEMALIKGGLNG